MYYLIINKKQFSGDSEATHMGAVNELNSLPEPVLVRSTPVSLKQPEPNTAILCLEGECLYFCPGEDGIIPSPGTKKMADCMGIYFTNGSEFAFIHVTATIQNLDLVPILEKFKNKTNITVMLLGGIKDHPRSMQNLHNIISALLEAVAKLNISIEIKSQKLLGRNVFTEHTRLSLMYDKIIESANLLSQHYFKKVIDKNFFKNFSVEDFKKPYTGRLEHRTINMFALVLASANKLFFSEIDPEIKFLDDIFKKCTESEFTDLLQVFFTRTGFEALSDHYNFSELSKNGTELYNFIINKEGFISEISDHIETPSEIARELIFLDPKRSREYRFCYDTDHYIGLELQAAFIKACASMIKKVDPTVIDGKVFFKFYNNLYPDRPLVANTPMEKSRNIRKITKIHAFICDLKRTSDAIFYWNQIIKDNPIYSTMFSLLYKNKTENSAAVTRVFDLNQSLTTSTLTPTFVAYTRRGPGLEPQVDALMPCQDMQTACEVQCEISAKNAALNPQVWASDEGAFVRVARIRGQS